MKIEERLKSLYERRRFGMKPGLERMRALLEELGNPEREIAAIHIAGTNGKGSVAAMCAAVLRQADMGKIGRFTSPHLVHFNERFVIDGEAINDDELEVLLGVIEQAARKVQDRIAQEPTFFECATALAFEYFRRSGARLAVIETGLGGRLDSTNVLMPVLSIITHIGLDHVEYLGHTLAAVAREKAGIIKESRPVVVSQMDDEALAVIESVAAERSAPLVQSVKNVSVVVKSRGLSTTTVDISSSNRTLGKVVLPLVGTFQVQNLATAIAALELFGDVTGIEISDKAFKDGLARIVWPGRFQLVKDQPPVVVDGAHNPDAAREAAATLRKIAEGRPIGLVMGFCDDKDALGVLRCFAGIGRCGWAVATPSDRSLDPEATAGLMRQAGIGNSKGVHFDEALAEAEAWALKENGIVFVSGSLFLVGEALRHYRVPGFESRDREADGNEKLKAT